MELKLQLLDTFHARGNDGKDYKVCAYDRMRRDETLLDGQERWLPSGTLEYRLDSGGIVEARADGALAIAHSGVTLERVSSPRMPAK